MKEKIGIIGTADIAYRRFLPALMRDNGLQYAGVATRDKENGKKFYDLFGGKIYEGYEQIFSNKEITSMYIPLPPALHYEWGIKCISNGINVFMEKPCSASMHETLELTEKAREANKVLYENYAFLYHPQLKKIKELIFREKILGDIRLIRINFSFPRRNETDFRYNSKLGGGALLDCGGYTIRLALELMGEKISVKTAKLNYAAGFQVDLYGTVTLLDENELVAQLAFGMDNGYKCELEVVGQKGWLRAPKIFTAPAEYAADIVMNVENRDMKIVIEKEDQFLNAIKKFRELIEDKSSREEMYNEIMQTAALIDKVRRWRQ